MTAEGYVKKAIEDLLKGERIRYWRMNAGETFIQGRRIRGHAKGTPDILAAFKGSCAASERCSEIPVFLWIECKAPGKAPTKEQLQFADEARNNGEYWLCIDDVKQLQSWLQENRAR